VRRENFDRLRPALVGAHTALAPDFLVQEPMKFWPDARRYEPGSLNLTGVVGLHAALQLIEDVGLASIEARVLALAEHAIREGQNRGLNAVGPTAGGGLTGIVTFESARHDLAAVHDRLAHAGVVTSLRRRRGGAVGLRLSPHFYNCEHEISTALAQV
jgi:selenocysteine lyase/cysteine desulfurase